MSKPFFGGIPTKPDVDRLLTLQVAEGDIISHETISQKVGVEHGTNRYRSVVDSWRKTLLEQKNLLLVSLPNIGYKVLTPTERVNHGVRDFVRIGKKIRKNAYLLNLVPEENLTQADQSKRDHIVRVSVSMLDTMNDTMKTIEPRKPDTLPRPRV